MIFEWEGVREIHRKRLGIHRQGLVIHKKSLAIHRKCLEIHRYYSLNLIYLPTYLTLITSPLQIQIIMKKLGWERSGGS